MCWVGFESQKQCGSTAETRRTTVRRFATGKNFQVEKQILKIANNYKKRTIAPMEIDKDQSYNQSYYFYYQEKQYIFLVMVDFL